MTNTSKVFLAVIIILALGLIFWSATFFNNKPASNMQTPPAQTASVAGCYVAKLANDVYTLQINSEDNGAVKGIVAFNNYQKDSSSGTFEGTLTGDILLGNYSFDSEGMRSDRQLIFKKVGNDFIEGFGDVKTVGSTESFVNTENVTYDSNSAFVKNANCTESFTASNGSFSFNYNPFFRAIAGSDTTGTDWELNAKQKGLLLATVTTPRSYLPQTNFSDAKLTIGRSTDINAIKNCLLDTSGQNAKGEASSVSGYPFTKFNFSDAGAGNFYETTSYQGLVGGDCYAIQYTIHSTNIGNYSPDQGIKEFDKTKIVNDLESIIKSLRLIVASN